MQCNLGGLDTNLYTEDIVYMNLTSKDYWMVNLSRER
jgi:hypothetical protein